MKNKRNIYFVSGLLILCQSIAMADCHTGFACSIADIEKQEKEKTIKNISTFKKYLEEKNKSRDILTKTNTINNYEDLFLFNSMIEKDF